MSEEKVICGCGCDEFSQTMDRVVNVYEDEEGNVRDDLVSEYEKDLRCSNCGKPIGNIEEVIKIPIYFYQKDNGEVIIDKDSIYSDLRNKLDDIEANPKKFLEIEDDI